MASSSVMPGERLGRHSATKVEGESWGGLVVVADKRDYPWKEGAGHYGLVQGVEWCSSPDKVTVWRGPRTPDQVISKRQLVEITCRSVQVDRHGFYICIPDPGKRRAYPCPQITEDLRDTVVEVATTLLTAEANAYGAESSSSIELEEVRRELWEDPDIWVVASFGDSTAVNGELVDRTKDAKPPKGWEKTGHGGSMAGGGEAEVEKQDLAVRIVRMLARKMKARIDPWVVRRILDDEFGEAHRDYIVWAAHYGTLEVWISPRLMRKDEKAREAAAHTEMERQRIRAAAEHRRFVAQQQQEKLERQERVKRGGFPEAQDWSPQGKLPWDD